MQNRKEELTEFVKTIKNKVHDWWVSYNRKLWTTRIFVYVFLLLLAIFVGAVLFAHFNLFHTDVDSARYMLSALVQSQAAIVAIVVSLTLIAVQLTASSYSPRVIDIFKKNPDMWILLGCYGVSIFYGFIVLKLVEGAEGEFVSQSAIWALGSVSISFESYVSLAYWLGAFTFVVLFPYMLNIINLLKPQNIIKRLSEEITRDKILKYIELAKTSKGVETRTVDDPVQPIVDIIRGSLMRYDLETTRDGLKGIAERAIKIIDSDEKGEEISIHFCDHLQRVGRLAASRDDEESIAEVIENLEKIGKSTAGKRLEDATLRVAKSLGVVGRAATEKRLGVTLQAVWSLKDLGSVAVENELESATLRIVDAFEWIGKTATEKKGLDDVVDHVAISLGELGEAAAEKGLDRATRKVAVCLRFLATKEIEMTIFNAALYLGLIGKSAAKKGLEIATLRAAKYLAELTILSEETATQAIRTCEYDELKDEDYEPFQKFMEEYKQELEIIRNQIHE